MTRLANISRIRYVLVLLAVAGGLTGFLFAQTGGSAGGGKDTPASRPAAKATASQSALAKAWSQFYAAKYAEAFKMLEPLLDDSDKMVRDEAKHLSARCAWSLGLNLPDGPRDDKAIAQATKLWGELAKSTSMSALSRAEIAKALQLSGQGKDAEAIEALKKVPARNESNTAMCEAAIDLGLAYARQLDLKAAEAAYDSVIKFANQALKTHEVPRESVMPYVDAAKKYKELLKIDPAEILFKKAEGLRNAKRFAEAIAIYNEVTQKFPDSDFAPRSEFSVGLCHLDAGKLTEAADHWKKFIAAANAGPWRGQAFVALFDLYLADLFNIEEAGKFTVLAVDAIPAGLADPKSKPSWDKVVFDVNYRVGVIAYAKKDLAAAADAFERTKTAMGKTGNKEIMANLDRMIAYARAGTPAVPRECLPTYAAAPADPNIATALGLGVVFNLVKESDAAERMFNRVLASVKGAAKPAGVPANATPIGMPSMEQIEFAKFGLACAAMNRGDNAKALTAFKENLKTLHPSKASWHDETLYCTASIIQKDAHDKYDPAPVAPRKTGFSETKEGDKSDSTSQPADKGLSEEKKLARQLAEALAPAIPYWNDLLKNCPNSPRTEAAMYNVGLTGALAEKYSEAIGALAKATEKFPNSQYAGQAHTVLIDTYLERMFDLPAAQKSAEAAVTWAKSIKTRQEKDGKVFADITESDIQAAWKPWHMFGMALEANDLRPALFGVYLRAGLTAYLDQKYDQAAPLFEAAKPFELPKEYTVIGGGGVGIDKMIEVARNQRKLTPEEVLKDDAKSKLILQIADIYYYVDYAERAERLFDVVISKDKCTPSATQISWAYYEMGRTLIWLTKSPVKARDAYLASVTAAPTMSWAGDATFLAGNICWNYFQNADEAIVLWKRVISNYRTHAEAPRSAYFVAVSLEWSNRPVEAKAAFENALQMFPGSDFTKLIYEHLTEVDKQIAAKQSGKSGK